MSLVRPRFAPLTIRQKCCGARPSTRLRRNFYSHEHPSHGTSNSSSAGNVILAAAYRHVPHLGFSQQALAAGARDARYLDISPAVLPHGPFSLIQYHLMTRRDALKNRVATVFQGLEGSSPVSIAQKVERLAWDRLLANKDIIHRWQEALAIMAQPTYVPASLRELSILSDEIWSLAGDRIVDSSWYTKRAALATIYGSSELFMTNDTSPNFSDTREFLRRRLDEASYVEGAMAGLGRWVSFTGSAAVNILRSKGVRV